MPKKSHAPQASNGALQLCNRRHFVRSLYWVAVSSPFLIHESLFLAEVHAQPASNIGIFKMDLNSFPVLRNTFGSVRLRVTGMPATFPQIVVTRVEDNQFFAVTSRCTHQGCTIGTYSAAISAIECPCHGSRFDADGSVVNGPALTPLTQYPNQYDGADLLRIEIPNLGFCITGAPVLVGANNTPRYRLSFPTVSGVTYEVRFRQELNAGAWVRLPFSTTPTGAATATALSGNGATATLYVDRSTPSGFYAVARL
jgi:nitrite reductase/ring-hydroxylating ferredoxin subunit